MGLAALTAEEDELQRERGLLYRSYVEDATRELLAEVERPAILLSGGVDSTTLLWNMLKLGARPGVFTYRVPGFGPSVDARRAVALAEHYGLTATVVELPSEPEDVTRGLEEIIRRYVRGWNLAEWPDEFPQHGLDTRADYEVSFIIRAMYREAARLGHDSIFTGAAESFIHLLGRKYEVLGRGGNLSVEECDAARLEFVHADTQLPGLSAIAREEGITLAAPTHLASALLPYQGVPWRVMNSPRNKAITTRAYEAEVAEAEVVFRITSLQCGDSGSREYFDGSVAASAHASEAAGRPVSTGTTFYNAVRVEARGSALRKARLATWPTWRNRVNGTPLPPDYVPPFPVDENGLSTTPPDVEGPLFGDAVDSSAVAWVAGPDGLPNRHTDCFGRPLWLPNSMNECPRALSGACSTPGPAVGWSFEACEAFSSWTTNAVYELRSLADHHGGVGVGAAYARWADRMEALYDERVAGARQACSG